MEYLVAVKKEVGYNGNIKEGLKWTERIIIEK